MTRPVDVPSDVDLPDVSPVDTPLTRPLDAAMAAGLMTSMGGITSGGVSSSSGADDDDDDNGLEDGRLGDSTRLAATPARADFGKFVRRDINDALAADDALAAPSLRQALWDANGDVDTARGPSGELDVLDVLLNVVVFLPAERATLIAASQVSAAWRAATARLPQWQAAARGPPSAAWQRDRVECLAFRGRTSMTFLAGLEPCPTRQAFFRVIRARVICRARCQGALTAENGDNDNGSLPSTPQMRTLLAPWGTEGGASRGPGDTTRLVEGPAPPSIQLPSPVVVVVCLCVLLLFIFIMATR